MSRLWAGQTAAGRKWMLKLTVPVS